jgi:PQQ-dependent catabolism-associated CXXCW motif protein
MKKTILAVSIGLFAMAAYGQVQFPKPPDPVPTYANEAEDWSVSPVSKPKLPPYHAKTPTTIPGARVIRTMELKGLLAANKNVVVIDVLDSKERRSIPGAHWMHGGGDGQLYGAERARFSAALEKLTGGDKSRPLVFLCFNSECWLSYNAALHALDAGYKDVIWYRGGTEAWRGAGQKTESLQRLTW